MPHEEDDVTSTREDAPPAFPTNKVVVAALVNLGNTASYLVSLPFVGFMVQHFYPDLGLNQVGYLSGMLEGVFHVGAVFGAMFWSHVSEKYGRRPAVLWGLAGSTAAALAFGFSPSFPLAMCARFAWGLLNGNIGVVKTMISDVCPDVHSARAFSSLGVAAGLGRVIGPTIGGLLSQPALKYPAVFGSWTLAQVFPFALPCAIGAALSFVTLLIAAAVLEETRHLAVAEQRAIDARIAAESVSVKDHRDSSGVVVVDDSESEDEGERSRLVDSATLKSSRSATASMCVSGAPLISVASAVHPVDGVVSASETSINMIDDPSVRTSARSSEHSTASQSNEEEQTCLVPSDCTQADTMTDASVESDLATTERQTHHSRCSDRKSSSSGWWCPCTKQCRLLRDGPICVSTLLYMGLGGITIVSTEVLPLQVSSTPL